MSMTALAPRAGVLRIKPHMADAQRPDTASEVLNIASNESAFGPSPAALAAATQALMTMERYPDNGPERLAAAVAERFALDESRIVCGHGSDDLLARIARAYLSAGDELIYSVNGYQKIPNYAFANDAEPVAAADRNFTADVDSLLRCLSPRTRMVMIANPDNPTGTYLASAEVRRLHAALPKSVLLVLDSAYAEYVDAGDYEDAAALVEEADNVVMTRTFSKIFGLASLRLGWLYGSAPVADAVRRIGITFPVSGAGLAAGEAALKDRDFADFVYAENKRIRGSFVRALEGLGLTVYPSQTNFVLASFRGLAQPAEEVNGLLADDGILARRFTAASFADCIRFTIGKEEEMDRVVRSLEKILKG